MTGDPASTDHLGEMVTSSGPSAHRQPAIAMAWALGAAGVALVLAGTVAALLGSAGTGAIGDARHVAVFALATAILALRAARLPAGRRAWVAFAIGCAVNTVAETVSVAAYDGAPRGAAAALYAVAYLTTAVALTLFLHRRVGDALRAFSLDMVGFAIALAAVGSTVLLQPIVDRGTTATEATLTIAFTAADLAIALVIWSIASITGRSRGPQEALLAGALAVMFAGDFCVLLGDAGVIADPAGWVRVVWECSMLLVAAAAWQRPGTAGAVRVGGPWDLVPTIAWAIAGLGTMIAAYALELPGACAALAIATLVLVGVRGSRMQLEVRDLIVMRAESLVDEVTGAANQRALFGELGLLMREGGDDGRRAALLIGHLEGFGELTDTLGHAVAGDVLRAVAGRLGDVAPGTLARLDHGEFATVVEDADPEAVAGLLEAALAAPVESDGIAVSVRPVFGYARFPEDARTPTGLARRADMARRDARDRGLGVAAYDAERDHHSRDRLTLATDLRHALRSPTAPDGSGLWVAFQPQVVPATGEPRGAEALIRWRHPARGPISPAELLPVAERAGLMAELTDWVLDRALAEAAALRAEGHPLHVAVNVSAMTLVEVGLPDRIQAALLAHRVPPEALVVEVTEDAVMRDHRRCREVLGRIAELGVEIAIDDFGTGHSSLAQLRHLPADELKIDQRFVRGMVEDPVDEELVRMMVGLGRKMGLRVVAEGAETLAERGILDAMGCDLVQGYVIGRPMAADQLRSWLGTHSPIRREAA